MNHWLQNFLFKNTISLLLCLLFFIAPSFSQTKSKKRGIAFGYHSEADMAAISKGVSWWYNWHYQPETSVSMIYQNYGMDFVPMAWGGTFNEEGLRAYYASHPDARYLLAFNEPNFTTQANLKPSQAAAIWPKLEKIAKDFNLKIVGPAVNYADKPVQENGVTFYNPVTYLDAFFAACPNCQVDYIAVHNYMCYSGALTDYINQFKKYNRPIWLTEFACWDQSTITLGMQKSLILGALDYLENEPFIFRYSWFTGNRSGNFPYIDLFTNQSGQLTELGQLYVNYNPVHDPNAYSPIPARLEAESYSAMSGISIETTQDVSGSLNVGWIDAGDWLEYNIEVATTADYTVQFRVSANSPTNLELRENNETLQTLQIPTSGGWQNWMTLQTNIHLVSGKHQLRIFTNTGMFNLNWFEIFKSDQPSLINEHSQPTPKIYPNPVKDILYIENGNNNDKTEVSVLDLSGRIINAKIFPHETPRIEIDFSNFKNGSYIVRTKNSGNVFNQLIVK